MLTKIDIQEFLEQRKSGHAILDVRSPSEFIQGHIPDAVNLPLFDDRERASVGYAYKQVGPQRAMELGLEIAGDKLKDLVLQAEKLANGKPVLVHCWRGGKRSGSIGWLLDFTGMHVSLLLGGYKAYRGHLQKWLEEKLLPFIVLGGKTGSGKTVILRTLAERGEQVLDLERLASHKGSAFGWIGEEQQPSTEQFENEIFETLSGFDLSRPIWVENESRTIGKVFVPESLWTRMRISPLIHVEVPLDERVTKLVSDYTGSQSQMALQESFLKIRKKLGGQNVNAALEALQRNDYHTAAEIALTYYDKTYAYGLETTQAITIDQIDGSNFNAYRIADQLMLLAQDKLHHHDTVS